MADWNPLALIGSQGVAGANGAPGGGVAIQYTFSTTTTDADPGNGNLRLSNATQNASTVIRADLLDFFGIDWTSVLDSLDDSSSVVKGQIRLSKVSDQSKWLTFNITATATPSGYRNLTVANIGSSTASPFANLDLILLEFTRTGDAGSLGAWKGAYDAGTAYIINDIVSYQGSTFICTVAGTGTAPTPASLQTAYSKAAGGRLTLVTGSPVPQTDTTGASAQTIYYTPYLTDEIGLYTSSLWQLYNFSELSIALTGLVTTQPYDIFIYDNAGTLTLEAVAWTDASNRAVAVPIFQGVRVKNGTESHRYLGTLQMQATGQCEDSVLRRYVFNMYNRVRRSLQRVDATASWTYTTATWRAANGSNSNRVAFVNGFNGEISAHVEVLGAANNSSSNIGRAIGICANGTTTPSTGCVFEGSGATTLAADVRSLFAMIDDMPAKGLNFYQWVEISTASGSCTFLGTPASNINGLYGMSGHVEL